MSLAHQRPRTVSEILDASVGFYRANFLTVVTIAMAAAIPPAVVKFFLQNELGLIIDRIGNFFIIIAQGAITAAVAASLERGEELNATDAFRATSGRRGSLIGVQILSGLMVGFGLILLVIPGLVAIAWTAVCLPVVVLERLDAGKAVGRSRDLSRGNSKLVLGTVFLTGGLALLLIIGVGAGMGLLVSDDAIIDLLSDTLFALFFPLPAIAMAFLYFDLRVRTEGADMEAMLSRLPVPPSPLATDGDKVKSFF
jgi:hypothetical protein